MAGMNSETNTRKQPMLSIVFWVCGIVSAVIAGLALPAVIASLVTGLGAAIAFLALPVLASSLVSALFSFGIAQGIDYWDRTAHAAEEAASAAKDGVDLLRQLIRSNGHEPEA